MMDDFDIYADLPSIHLEENEEISDNKNIHGKETRSEDLEKEVTELKLKFEKLESLNNKLQINFSSLFKTAKAEISRKDRIISDLRLQLDNVTFRRNRTHAHRTSAVSTKHVKSHQEISFPPDLSCPPPKISFVPNLNYPPPENPVIVNSEEQFNQQENNYLDSEDTMPDISHNIKCERYEEYAKNEEIVTKGSHNSYQPTVYGERLRKKFFEEKEDESRKKEARIQNLQKQEIEDTKVQIDEPKQNQDKTFDTLNNKENFSHSHKSTSDESNNHNDHKTSDLTRNSKDDDLFVENSKHIQSKDNLYKYNNDTLNSNKYAGYNSIQMSNTTSNSSNRKSHHYSHSYNQNYPNSKDSYYQSHDNRGKFKDSKYSESCNRYSRYDKYPDQIEKHERHRSLQTYRSNDREKSNDRQRERDVRKKYEAEHVKHNKISDCHYNRSPKRIKIHKTQNDYQTNSQYMEKVKNYKERSRSPKRPRRSISEEIPRKRQKLDKQKIDIKSDINSFKNINNYPLETKSCFREKVKDKVDDKNRKFVNSVDNTKKITELRKNVIITTNSESATNKQEEQIQKIDKKLNQKSNISTSAKSVSQEINDIATNSKQYITKDFQESIKDSRENLPNEKSRKEDNYKSEKYNNEIINSVLNSNKNSTDIYSDIKPNRHEDQPKMIPKESKVTENEVSAMERKMQKNFCTETDELNKNLMQSTVTSIKNQQEETYKVMDQPFKNEESDADFVNYKTNENKSSNAECLLKELKEDKTNLNEIILTENLNTVDSCQKESNIATLINCTIKSDEGLKNIETNNIETTIITDNITDIKEFLSNELELDSFERSKENIQKENFKEIVNDKIQKNDGTVINSDKNVKGLQDIVKLHKNGVIDTHSEVKEHLQNKKYNMIDKQCKSKKNLIPIKNTSQTISDKQINTKHSLPIGLKENSKKIIHSQKEIDCKNITNNVQGINESSKIVKLNNIKQYSESKNNLQEENSKKINNKKHNTVLEQDTRLSGDLKTSTIDILEELEEGEIRETPTSILEDNNLEIDKKFNFIKTEVYSEVAENKQNSNNKNSKINIKSSRQTNEKTGSSCNTIVKKEETVLLSNERSEKDLNSARLDCKDSKNFEIDIKFSSLNQKSSRKNSFESKKIEGKVSCKLVSHVANSKDLHSLVLNKDEISNVKINNDIDQETDELSLSKRILSSTAKIKRENNGNLKISESKENYTCLKNDVQQKIEIQSVEENKQLNTHKNLSKKSSSPLVKNKDICNSVSKSIIDYSKRKTTKNVIKMKCRRRQVQLSDSFPILEVSHDSKISNKSN